MCEKRRYRSELKAKQALDLCQFKGIWLERRRETRYYQCPDCHYWHLTSKPAREESKIN